MKKGVGVFFIALSVVFVLLISLASASAFTDFFKKLDGKKVMLSPSGSVSFSSPMSSTVVAQGVSVRVAWQGTGFSSNDRGYLYLYDSNGNVIKNPYQNYIDKGEVVEAWSLYASGGYFDPTLRKDLPSGKYKFVIKDGGPNSNVLGQTDLFSVRSGQVPSPTSEEQITGVIITNNICNGYVNIQCATNKELTFYSIEPVFYFTSQKFEYSGMEKSGDVPIYSYKVYVDKGINELSREVGCKLVQRSPSYSVIQQNTKNYDFVGNCGGQTATCNDSDGGKNYLVKGEVTEVNEYSDWNKNTFSDMCVSDVIGKNLAEAVCVNGYGSQEYYDCPNGCEDGKCISVLGKSCFVDATNCNLEWKSPICGTIVKSANGNEELCNVPSPVSGSAGFSFQYDGCSTTKLCLNGCSDGACVQSPQTATCSELVNEVKNPKDFSDGNINYRFEWDGSYDGEWNGEGFKEYSASWSLNYEDGGNQKSGYIQKSAMIFNDVNFEAMGILNENKDSGVCEVHGYGWEGRSYNVYVCNWNIYNRGVNINGYTYNNREILWAHDNVLVRISLGSGQWLSDEQLAIIIERETKEFLNSLRDNPSKYVGWENFDIDWPFSNQVFDELNSCPSDVPLDVCSPRWECVTEPAVCPEYGTQKQTCRDTMCGDSNIVNNIDCNPGICSGCMIPKWFDSKSLGNNKCIPYGFRFENQIGWNYDGTYEESDRDQLSIASANGNDINLTISSDGVASLSVKEWGSENYVFVRGDNVNLNIAGWEDGLVEASMYVNDVVYDSNNYEYSYIDVTFTALRMGKEVSSIVSYCDFDGEVKPQKSKDSDTGNWAKCQNNYECESNVCSNGQCYEILDMINEASKIKTFFVKILCKFANPFSDEEYNTCLVNFLGE